MPVTREANGRTATNAPLLAAILARFHARRSTANSSTLAQLTLGRRRSASAGRAASLKAAPARSACRLCSSRRQAGSGSPTSHLALRTRMSPARALSLAGLHTPVFPPQGRRGPRRGCLIAAAGLARESRR